MPGQQEDYILREIAMLRRLVARLTGKRDPVGIEEALQASFDLQQKLFQMPAAEFLRLEVSEQVARLSRFDSPMAAQERCLTYVGLLQETARIYDFKGNDDLAGGARQLALQVALHLALQGPPNPAADALVRELAPRLAAAKMYPPVRDLLEEFVRRNVGRDR